jgi:hypothetical protein
MPNAAVSITSPSTDAADVDVSWEILFATLPESGFDTMTHDGVEFVLCASALTAQM